MILLSIAVSMVIIRILILRQSRPGDASPVYLAASFIIISFTFPFPPLHFFIRQFPREELFDETWRVAGKGDLEVHEAIHHFPRDDLVHFDQGEIPFRGVAADSCHSCILEHAHRSNGKDKPGMRSEARDGDQEGYPED